MIFQKLEALWQAFQAPIQAPERPTRSPPNWEAALEELWEQVWVVVPAALTPTPPLPEISGWPVELEALWQAFQAPIQAPESLAPPPPPAEPAWLAGLEKLWGAFGQPIVIELPAPSPVARPHLAFDDAEASWAEFQLALLDLPLPPRSWREFKRRIAAAETTRPRSVWEWWLRARWEALVELFDQSDPVPVELPKPRKRPRPGWEELFGAWQLAIAPIVPGQPLRLHQPEPAFSDLPNWEQAAYRSLRQFEKACRQLDKWAKLTLVVGGRVVPTWELDLERSWQAFIMPDAREISQLEIEEEAASLSRPARPLSFEEMIKNLSEEGRASGAKRRSGKKRAGAEIWPTHQWKASQRSERSGPGWIHLVRWVPIVETIETVERTTHWTGRTQRRWVIKRELVGFEPRAERIRSTTLEAWEDRNEWRTTNLRLAQPGRLRRPNWLSEEDWRLRLESREGREFAAMLEKQLSAPSPVVRKFDRIFALLRPTRPALPAYALVDPLFVGPGPVSPAAKKPSPASSLTAKIDELLAPQVASQLADLAKKLTKEERPSSGNILS